VLSDLRNEREAAVQRSTASVRVRDLRDDRMIDDLFQK
jgi:hypothetical protein